MSPRIHMLKYPTWWNWEVEPERSVWVLEGAALGNRISALIENPRAHNIFPPCRGHNEGVAGSELWRELLPEPDHVGP